MRVFVAFLIFSALLHGVAWADVYTDAGCKPVDRVWAASDYQVFVALLQSGEAPLPRAGDFDSDTLLSRLCSEENLHFCAKKEVPLQERLGELSGILKALAEFQKHILDTTDKRQRVGLEFAMVAAFSMHVQAQTIRLIKTEKSEGEGEMKDWIAKFYRACGAMMDRARKILETDGLTSPEGHTLVLSAIASSTSDFASTMSKDQRRDSAQAFEALRARFTSIHDVKAIDKIVSALELQ